MTETTIVRMRTGVRIPAHVLGEDADVRVSKGEEPDLPSAYAQRLVDDGFAVFPQELEADDDGVENQGAPPIDLATMNRADLLTEAKRRGITVKGSDTKADLIAALGAAA